MENLSLYQINSETEQLEECIDENCDKETGEIIDLDLHQILLEKFKSLQMSKENKIKGCIYLLHKFEDNVELIDKEITRLKGLKEKEMKKDKYIRQLLIDNIEPGRKLELGTVGIGWRKSTGIIIDNEEEKLAKIEKEIKEFLQEKMDQDPKMAIQILGGDKAPYTKIKIEATFNKSAIKDDLKNGIEIQGCRLDERENMQIK